MTQSELIEAPSISKPLEDITDPLEFAAALKGFTDDPLGQLLALYIEGAETGVFDTESIASRFRAARVREPFSNWRDVFSNYVRNSRELARLNNWQNRADDFIHSYMRSILDDKFSVKITEAAESEKVKRIYDLINRIPGGPKSPKIRDAKDHEKNRYANELFLKRFGRDYNPANSLNKRISYRETQRRAEMLESTEPVNIKMSLEQIKSSLKSIILDLAKDIIIESGETLPPDLKVSEVNIQGSDKVAYIVHRDDEIESLQKRKKSLEAFKILPTSLTQGQHSRLAYVDIELPTNIPSLLTQNNSLAGKSEKWLEFRLSIELIGTIMDYINSDIDLNELLERKDTIMDSNKYIAADYSFSSIIKNLQLLYAPNLESLRSTSNNMLSILGKVKENFTLTNMILSGFLFPVAIPGAFVGFAAITPELGSIMDIIKSITNIKLSMTGNPLNLARFPSALSVFNPSKLHSPEFTFQNYSELVKDQPLNSKVTVASRVPFKATEDGETVYIALPQYAPIARIDVAGSDSLDETLILNEDYILEYEQKTGHYRLTLISDRAKKTGRNGLIYNVGLDFLDKQISVPTQVYEIELSSDKVVDICRILAEAGFGKLASNLEQSLTPKKNPLKRSRENKNKYTTKDIADAIGKSIYYSFGSSSSQETLAANEILKEAIDANLDFSFLATPTSKDKTEEAKIKVQCAQVAELYAILINYLFADSTSLQLIKAFSSQLFTDPTGGITTTMGFKVFSSPHGDTRAIIASNDGIYRFQEDVTPSLGLLSVIDAAKSAFSSTIRIKQRLAELKAGFEGNFSNLDRYYLNLISDQNSFDMQVRDLKKEIAELSNLFKNPAEIERFVAAEPGQYKNIYELVQTVDTNPLAAVMNIILLFQDKGKDGLASNEERDNAIKVLSDIIRWANDFRGMDEFRQRLSQAEEKFKNEVIQASYTAQKLLLIISYAQFV